MTADKQINFFAVPPVGVPIPLPATTIADLITRRSVHLPDVSDLEPGSYDLRIVITATERSKQEERSMSDPDEIQDDEPEEQDAETPIQETHKPKTTHGGLTDDELQEIFRRSANPGFAYPEGHHPMDEPTRNQLWATIQRLRAERDEWQARSLAQAQAHEYTTRQLTAARELATAAEESRATAWEKLGKAQKELAEAEATIAENDEVLSQLADDLEEALLRGMSKAFEEARYWGWANREVPTSFVEFLAHRRNEVDEKLPKKPAVDGCVMCKRSFMGRCSQHRRGPPPGVPQPPEVAGIVPMSVSPAGVTHQLVPGRHLKLWTPESARPHGWVMAVVREISTQTLTLVPLQGPHAQTNVVLLFTDQALQRVPEDGYAWDWL